jgi:hypothetical protein
MQRTSDSIGTLAAALAKAQCDLINPEKSLAATIQSERPGGPDQTFRYAPLSSGLEIVRKTLGQHEIAVAQTTSIDRAAGIVNLTTVLAHASGEWIASDWPVCPISDTATPHRMGKALTYARRYALFTLVGIAGEDDLDAPDLITPIDPSSGTERPKPANASLNGGGRRHDARRNDPHKGRPPEPPLAPKASAELRDRLIHETNELKTGDEAALWARRRLGEKNRLTSADAQFVEETFQARLAALTPSAANEPGADKPARTSSRRPRGRTSAKARTQSAAIDKSILPFPEPRRIRDKDHLRFVAKYPCLMCGRRPADPHHLRFAQSQAIGRKVSDEFTVPLCRGHHREVHRSGDEAIWWSKTGIDPLKAARRLWLETHPLSAGRTGDGACGHAGERSTGAVDRPPKYQTKPIDTDARP